MARDICSRIADGATGEAAAQAEVEDALSLGGYGGVVVMDTHGVPAFVMTTTGMYRGLIGPDRAPYVAIYGDEPRP